MSTDKKKPPTITPTVVVPRPDSPGRPRTTPPPPPPPAEGAPLDVDEATVAGMERASGESKVAVARAGAVKAAAEAIASAKSAQARAVPPAGAATPSVPADQATKRPTPAATVGVPAAADTPAAAIPPASSAAAESFAPRKIRLAVSKVNPWSVMKLAFLLSVAVGIMAVVAVIVLWLVLDGMLVFSKIDDLFRQVVGEAADVDILQFVEFSRVVSQAMIIAVVNVVIMTFLATIMAFLYNITAALVGGVHVTLTDD